MVIYINYPPTYCWPELMVFHNMMGLGGRSLVLDTTIDTYLKYDYFEHFSASKCQHFERTARTLLRLLV